MKSMLPVVFALLTALCWGLYGPTLGLARSPEKPPLYSPFKPYVGIGLAYLFWAVIGGGMVMLFYTGDSFSLSGGHSRAATWGFIAGSLGAVGALTLTFAMFSGGTAMPHIVMPIVFGGAVSVTAITTVVMSKSAATTSPWLWIGMAGMAVCIVIVASNTPHAAPGHKPPATTAPTPEQSAGSTEQH